MKKRIFKIGSLFIVIGLVFLGWKMHRKKKPIEEVHLKVYGVAKMGDGIGRQSAELIRALKNEISIAFVPTGHFELQDVPEDLIPTMADNKKKSLSKVAILEDILCVPWHAPWKKLVEGTTPEQIRIAYSMLESTKIPTEWVFALNGYFDAVVVPDPFLVDVYRNCGVEIPVFVLPLGLYLDDFIKQPLHVVEKKPMIFGFLSQCIERKNHLNLIRGFAKAFGNRDDVLLMMNYRSGDDYLIKKIRDEISLLGLQNVHFTGLPLDRAAYLRYFKTLDCYVSLTKGEGYSIQPREAMALGIPVIAADNTAQQTLCRSGLVRSVPSNVMIPALYWWGEIHGKQFDCEIDDITDAFLDMFQNYEQYIERGAAAREWVRNTEFKNLKYRYLNLVKPKTVILGNQNIITDDYLMTTSESLYNKYKKL